MKASPDQFYEAGDVRLAEELLGLDATAPDVEKALLVPPTTTTTTTPIIDDETTKTIFIIFIIDIDWFL